MLGTEKTSEPREGEALPHSRAGARGGRCWEAYLQLLPSNSSHSATVMSPNCFAPAWRGPDCGKPQGAQVWAPSTNPGVRDLSPGPGEIEPFPASVLQNASQPAFSSTARGLF